MSHPERNMNSVRAELLRRILGHQFGFDNDAERVEGARQILNKYPNLCKEKGNYAYLCGLLLHFAVSNKAPLEILEHIVACYPEALVAQDWNDSTPLHRACVWNDRPFELFELLTNEEAACIRDKNGMLPLHCYCQGSLHTRTEPLNLQIVPLLVDAFPESVRLVDNDGNTPLELAVASAVENEEIPVIRYLLELYPEAVTRENDDGPLLIHTACYSRCPNILRFLVEEYPQTSTVVDELGTPLHCLLVHAFLGRPKADLIPFA